MRDLLDFLALRAVPGVEVVEQTTYRRALGGQVVEVDLGAPRGAAGRGDGSGRAGGSPATGWSRLSTASGDNLDHPVAERRDPGAERREPVAEHAHPAGAQSAGGAARGLLATLAGPDEEVAAAAAHLGTHPLLGPLVRAAPDLRVPGHPDGAELAVRAILGQQISVAGARTLAGRLTAAHGDPVAAPGGGVTHAFPSSAALAALDPESLPMPRSRGRALAGLASALAGGDLDLSAGVDPTVARAGLVALPGIGPWTADYVLMRAQRVPDVLLVGDLGVRHALIGLGADTSTAALRRLAAEVAPWGSYATMHLWRTLTS